jgi:(4S)-4-hydroxy-5-phosphonooxypentane-2,3-dione isomerase
MNGTFVVIVDFKFKDGQSEAGRRVLLEQATNSLANEPGCERFDVVADPADPLRFWLYEIYADAAAFAAHQTYPHYHAFAAASTPLIDTKTVRKLRLEGP